MDLARVIGTVVATRRDALLESYRLAVVQPLDQHERPTGNPVVAIDALNRRTGDLVYIVRSGDAMSAHHGDGYMPTDCGIGGLVDTVYIANEEPKR